MVALSSLIFVLFLSLIVVRIGAEALTLTGLSRQEAKFQARSAWTGTGFTTTESEDVVGHPVRREIVSLMMLLRSAGLVTAATTLMLSFVNVEQQGDGLTRFFILLAALVALWRISRSGWVDKRLSKVISWALKRVTDLETRDYEGLLHLAGDYAIMELKVRRDSWLAGRTLGSLELPQEGVLVLGIHHRDGSYLGAPPANSPVRPGDVLILYGQSAELAALNRRRASAAAEAEHRAAVAGHRQEQREEAIAEARR
jgi:hypothetical protein